MNSLEIKSRCWLRTFTGKVIDPYNITEDDISEVDIARALSHMCRYGGHCTHFYSVAQHSLLVADLAVDEAFLGDYNFGEDRNWQNNIKLIALLHDASEAYLSDIPTPFKQLLPQYKELEAKVMNIIHSKFKIKERVGLNLELYESIVDKMDKGALDYEMPFLFENVHGIDLNPMTSELAFSIYLSSLIKELNCQL